MVDGKVPLVVGKMAGGACEADEEGGVAKVEPCNGGLVLKEVGPMLAFILWA